MPLIDGQKLEMFRNKKGVNQSVAAKAIGLSQGAYSVREKTGNFDLYHIDKLCELLEIKKEQIEIDEENADRASDINYLFHKSIQHEAFLEVILATQAEILAKLTNGSATKIRTDLVSVVNSLSKQALEKLGRAE